MEQRKTAGFDRALVETTERKALVQKWNQYIPAQIKNPHTRYVMAQLFENQKTDLLQAKAKMGINEDTQSSNAAPFIKYTFPLLRRVYPSLIAPEIVSVQP